MKSVCGLKSFVECQMVIRMVEVGKEICCPWTPRRIIEVKPYKGLYRDIFDCVLVILADTRKGFTEMAYHSKDWNYDQHLVSEWYLANGKKK